MSFDPSPKVQALQQQLTAFMDEHIYPAEKRFVQEAEELGPRPQFFSLLHKAFFGRVNVLIHEGRQLLLQGLHFRAGIK